MDNILTPIEKPIVIETVAKFTEVYLRKILRDSIVKIVQIDIPIPILYQVKNVMLTLAIKRINDVNVNIVESGSNVPTE